MFCDGVPFQEDQGFVAELPMPTLAGDYYHMRDDVTRGLSLYDGVADFGQVGGFCGGASEFYHLATEPTGKLGFDDFGTCSKVLAHVQGDDFLVSRFQECDEAPAVPADDFFQFEQTTFVVVNSTAADIGNLVLDFLRTQVSSLIVKMKRAKFTIKAEVLVDGLSCETKVRIYRQAFGQYAIEMQRRSGDSLAFYRAFELASQHVNSKVQAAAAASDSLLPPPPLHTPEVRPTFELVPDQVSGEDNEVVITPLLDLVEFSADRQLQTEAMQALSQAADDINAIEQLCSARAFIVYQSLLQLICFSVAEPLARLLCCLSVTPDASLKLCNEHHLLQVMIKSVWSNAVGQIASEQFARAVCHTISQSAAHIPQSVSRELVWALADTLGHRTSLSSEDTASPKYSATVQHLEDSLHMLSISRTDQVCW